MTKLKYSPLIIILLFAIVLAPLSANAQNRYLAGYFTGDVIKTQRVI